MKRSFLAVVGLFCAFAMMAQNHAAGVVTLSDTGEPEPGVNVIITGTSTGTITDIDGNFELSVPDGKTLTISYIGYQSQTVSPSGNMNIVLQPEESILEEVVAVGYATMKKSDVTGAISSVKSEQLQRTPASGVDQALQGRAAGVTVNASSGQPGQAAQVRIRGIGSALSSNDPIYVVDGAIVTDISFLSPNDIASMEVLKDASSTAIYGSRAANGVILITTKTGSKDRPANISFNAYWGFQNMANTLDVLGRDDMAKVMTRMEGTVSKLDALEAGFMTWWSSKNGTASYLPSNFKYDEQETDWQKAIQNKNAFIHNYHLSIDGGSEKGAYAISASYFNQEGTIIGSDYQRLTLRLNSDLNVRSWLKVGENLSFMTSSSHNAMNNNGSGKASMLTAALSMAPWDPVSFPEGTVSFGGEDLSGKYAPATNFTNVTNPYNMTYQHNSESKSERWVGDLFLEIKPVKGLTIRPSISMDLANNPNKEFKFIYYTSDNDQMIRNFCSSGYNHYLTLINENIVTYAREIGKHNFSVMVGESMEQYKHTSLGASATDFLFEDELYQYVSMGVTDSTKRGSDGISRTRRLSAFSRLFYCFDNRYIATVNFRADGSSKFSDQYMWGYFPSASLAWRMSEESWMKGVKHLDYMKLRLGWGQVGNDQVGDDSFILKISQPGPYFVGYTLGADQKSVAGSAVTTLVNTGGHWETTEQWNAGFDFGTFNNMFNGTVDFFCRDTKEMLFNVKQPAQVGNMWDPTCNVGTARNIGVELTLDHQHSVGDFNYNISFNMSYLKNYITELADGNPIYGDYTLTNEGFAINTFYGYHYEGIYKSDAEAAEHMYAMTTKPNEGDAKFTDVNGDGRLDEKDKMDLGNAFPILTGGLNFEASYKGFDLQIFFQGSYGNKLYNVMRQYLEGTGAQNTVLSSEMLDHVYYYFSGDKAVALEKAGYDWRAWQNEEATIPNPYGHANNTAVSDRFVEDASYLRLKNVTLGYTLPARITKKAYINRLRFYVTGSNLFTLTKYRGYDPEVGGSGVDYGNYPQSRTIMFGMNLDF